MALGKVVEHEIRHGHAQPGGVPQPDVDTVSSVLNITQSPGGFFMEYHPKLRPIDTPTDGVFLAGACQGPKDIPASVASGLGGRFARRAHPPFGRMGDRTDRGSWSGRTAASAPRAKSAACAPRPARMAPSTVKWARRPRSSRPSATAAAAAWPNARTTPSPRCTLPMRRSWRSSTPCWPNKPEEKILAFLCHWCSYGGADMAGTSHFEYSANERGIRVMCSARMDNDFIYEAFRLGAGAVLYLRLPSAGLPLYHRAAGGRHPRRTPAEDL